MSDRMVKTLNKAIVEERLKQSAPLFASLTKSGVPFVVHKGAPLLKMIYGDPFHRISGDIDLLLPREYIERAKTILTESGFMQGRLVDGEFIPATRQEQVFFMAHTHQTAPFYKRIENPLCPYVCIDINMSIYWGESGKHINMEEFLNDRINYEVLSGYMIPISPPEKSFFAMCLHHYKDMFSLYLLYHNNGYPLSHLEDINRFLKNVTLDIDKLLVIIDYHKAEKYIYVCLDAVNRFFPDTSDRGLMEILYKPGYEKAFYSFGLTEEESQPWPCDPVRMIHGAKTRDVLDEILEEAALKKIKLNEYYIG